MAVTITQIRDELPDNNITAALQRLKDASIQSVITRIGAADENFYEIMAQCCFIIGSQQKLDEEKSTNIAPGAGVSSGKNSGTWWLARARALRAVGKELNGTTGYFDSTPGASNIDEFGRDRSNYIGGPELSSGFDTS